MSVTDKIKKLEAAGGFAFGVVDGRASASGMTLRDYFAGQVISNDDQSSSPDQSAEWAYRIADAMLEARK